MGDAPHLSPLPQWARRLSSPFLALAASSLGIYDEISGSPGKHRASRLVPLVVGLLDFYGYVF